MSGCKLHAPTEEGFLHVHSQNVDCVIVEESCGGMSAHCIFMECVSSCAGGERHQVSGERAALRAG